MKVMSVSALNKAIKYALEPGFSQIQVEGEVTNLRHQSSGHLYFSLKDDKSQISSVFFKGFYAQCPIEIKAGDRIVVLGDLSVYEPRGSYQIIVKKAKKAGVGDLLAKIHALKLELEKLGWFKEKKPLPPFPKTIGVITSPTGSVIQDILHVLNRRYSGFQLILNPVKVQGEGAAQEIAAAIEQMNHYKLADVLIVGRGGGSLEDLMPFNERCVAEAMHKSEIPIISAVGHETDVSIADFVADARAPTPSAAAEIVMKEKSALLERLNFMYASLQRQLEQRLQALNHQLRALSRHPILSDPTLFLRTKIQRLDEVTRSLELKMEHQLAQSKTKLEGKERLHHSLNPLRTLQAHRQKLDQYATMLTQSIQSTLASKSERLVGILSLAQSINPKKLLSRGYCIPFSQNKESVIISSKQVSVDDSIRLLMNDGELTTQVRSIHHDDKEKSLVRGSV